jgi:hypothetical protein
MGGEAVYFASSMFGGVAYFTAPLPPRDAVGDDGEITVFDTTSAPVPVHTRGRHLVVSASAVDGRRTLVEVFELSNDTTVTAVSGPRGRATWSTPLAPNGTDFQVGQGDIGNNAVQFRDGRVLVYASFSPGIRQIAFSYSIPASDFPLTIPVGDPVSVLEVLVEDPGATANGGGLKEQQPVSLEGRSSAASSRRTRSGENPSSRWRADGAAQQLHGCARPRGGRHHVDRAGVRPNATSGGASRRARTLRRIRAHRATSRSLDDAFERGSASDAEREAYASGARCSRRGPKPLAKEVAV